MIYTILLLHFSLEEIDSDYTAFQRDVHKENAFSIDL